MNFSTELKHLRKEKEKHFLQKDGTIVAKIYQEDIHYLKDGKYEEIDNTLIKKGNRFQNRSNSFQAIFDEKDKSKLLEVENNGHKLLMSFRNELEVCPTVSDTEICYPNLLEGIDVTYKVLSNKVKEAIILKENKYSKIDFMIETDLELVMKGKKIEAKDKDETIFVIEAPYMEDAKGEYNENIYYELEKHGNHYDVILKLDEPWLGNASFPVIIDPTISNYNGGKTYDAELCEGSDIAWGDYRLMNLGVQKDPDGNIKKYRGLFKFDLPKIGTGSQIIKAEVGLEAFGAPYQKKDIFAVHRVTKDWNENEATYKTMWNAYDPKMEAYTMIATATNPSNPDVYTYINLTNLVKAWYSDTPNYGILIKSYYEVYDPDVGYFIVYTSENTAGATPPFLLIHYRNQSGLESYMDYQTSGFTDGSTSTNMYNGNLVSAWDIGRTISGKFPVNLSIIYNTNDIILENDYGYGLGQQLSLHQTLEFETLKFADGSNVELLRYKDGDGTFHYFYKGSDIVPEEVEGITFEVVTRDAESYYDEDGLSLVVSRKDDNFIMKDNDGNQNTFTKNGDIWYLTELKDTKGSAIKIEYSDKKIIKVIDGESKEMNLIYGTNMITIQSPNEVVTLHYQNNLLTSIVTKNGTTNITYNGKKIIETIVDVTGRSIKYEYYDTIPYRIKKISEYSTQNKLGNYLEFVYGCNTTTLKDQYGKYQTYTFNDNGNTVGITNLNNKEEIKEAYGQTLTYGSKNHYTTSFGSVNKLLSETSMVKVVKNYLENSSFEKDVMLFKEPDIVTYAVPEGEFVSFSTTEYENGSRSLYLNGGALSVDSSFVEQSVKVPKGKHYTFSAYLKIIGAVKMVLEYLDKDGLNVRKDIDADGGYGFDRYDVTIFYPEDATSDLILKFEIERYNYCYIDAVQLEEGEVANLYNFIDNSDFSNGIGDFEFHYNRILPTPAPVENKEAKVVTLSNGSHALKVSGSPYLSESIRKTFPISGKAGDVYTIYFWYKNEGIENILTSTYDKRVLIGFDYGEVDDPHGLIPRGNFTMNNTTWQFFEETFMAEYDYTSFTLSIFNDCTANDLYLTNFALYKPIQAVGYEYNEKGNVTKVSDPLSGPKELFYDKNNQLVGMMDVKGSNFVYEYDNEVKDRILKGISASGITNEIEYDENGNPVITKIVNKNKREEIEGIYHIRMKGTKKYFDNNFYMNMISLRTDCCSHDKYEFIKEDGFYRIVPVDHPKYSVHILEERIVLSRESYSLFELIKNQNGSYMFKRKRDIVISEEPNEDIDEGKEPEPDPKDYVTFDGEKLILGYKELENPNQNFYLEETDSDLFVVNEATYTEDGKYIKSTRDTLGRMVAYDIDELSGLTNSVTDSKGITTSYSYNDKEQLIKVEKDSKKVEYEYNDKNLLSKIKHGTKDYNFTYDEFLNTKEIKVNNNILITNTYEENNGKLLFSKYGNNDIVTYTYDDFDRVKTISRMDDNYTFYYDNLSNISRIESKNDTYKYYYDLCKRLTDYRYNNMFRIKYDYDEKSNVKSKSYRSLYTSHKLNYEYNKDDSVIKVILNNENDNRAVPYSSNPVENYSYEDILSYTYDELGRIKEKSLNDVYKTNYHFITKGKRTSFMVDKVKDNFNEFDYKYDELDNITDIYRNKDLLNQYEYDNSNQLVKDYDYERNIKTIYTYDNVGNILSRKEYKLDTDELLKEDIYEYNNPNWEDQLTKFNDEVIVYDEIGNPLSIGNQLLTWTNGRQLKRFEDNQDVITYEYNKDGIRTKKIVNGEEITYYLENNDIIFEERPESMIYYKRDENGQLVGLRCNYKHYYYLKNLQNDIIGIMDDNYNVIANYKYDSYGKVISVTDENGNEIIDLDHIAHINPFRYRSYYYDEETKLYYLNSRYYNPEFGRFINADKLLGNTENIECNLYCYCSNNSINNIDSDGNFALSMPLVTMTGLVLVGLVLLSPQGQKASKDAAKAACQLAVEVVNNTVEAVKTAVESQSKAQTKKRVPIQEQRHSVYTLRDEKDEDIVKYVGRTVDYERRCNEHKNNPSKAGLECKLEKSDLSYIDARIEEERLIVQYGLDNLLNKRHGISPKSELYKFVIVGEVPFPDSLTYVGG